MRFSEVYGPLDLTRTDDWYDAFLPADTRLCVDPFLIYENDDPAWAGAHTRVIQFFAVAFDLVHQAGGNRKSAAWRKAERLLLFPEPAEFCLGVAEGSPLGAGSSKGLQIGMLEGIEVALANGIDNVPHVEMLGLFEGGMGLDRISDAVCNILKEHFICYTQEICRRHGIPMQKFRVKHGSWSEEFARWNEPSVELPANPFLPKPMPVLLAPEKFLRAFPVVTSNGFWDYAWTTHAEELREDFNWDVARKVAKEVRARMARRNVPLVLEYLEKLEGEKHEPYDILSDPYVLIKWYELGAGFAEKNPLSFIPQSPNDFGMFVESIVKSFAHNIEHQDGWQLLWNRTRGIPEKRVQMVFRAAVIHYCRAHGIVLSGESNAGRGPVDFKFSQGWNAQALVEIKLMRNSKFWNGILEQTKEYSISEEVKHAIFLAIAYLDHDMKPDKLATIARAAEMASRSDRTKVVPVVVDARRKISASKLQAPKSDLDELHGRDADEGQDDDDLDEDDY